MAPFMNEAKVEQFAMAREVDTDSTESSYPRIVYKYFMQFTILVRLIFLEEVSAPEPPNTKRSEKIFR